MGKPESEMVMPIDMHGSTVMCWVKSKLVEYPCCQYGVQEGGGV